MLVRLEQYEKAPSPMEVTELGMVMPVRLEHHVKAELPMEVTESGMVMLVRPEHPLKASFPMEVTFIPSYSSGIIQTQSASSESIGSFTDNVLSFFTI